MKQFLRIRITAVAVCVVCTGMSNADTVQEKGKIVRKEGKHVSMELREANWKILKDPKAYLDFFARERLFRAADVDITYCITTTYIPPPLPMVRRTGNSQFRRLTRL